MRGKDTMKLSPLSAILLRFLGNAVGHIKRGEQTLFVITYHRILPKPNPMLESEPDLAEFRWQMEVLARCFNVLPLSQALKLLDAGKLPPRAVCVTFDDGYRSVHDLALPVLKEFGLPATVFVTSGFLDGGVMWNDRIITAIQSMKGEQLDMGEFGLGVLPLGSVEERKTTSLRVTEGAKYLPPDERSRLVEHLEALVGEPVRGLMLTPDMVVSLDRNGIEIGAHTVTHPILTSLDNSSARAEIVGSKEYLENLLGKPVPLFAYPNGKVGVDYDASHISILRENGFAAAFTTAIGAITRTQDRFQLPRSRPWDRTPFLFGVRLLRWLAHGT
jgi:peptidoglycan/xylan/chitin deacetylase (PgdA/CDA1 family)